jgi:nitrogen fixation/metabolism regulation signal transduction histidine kinase
VKLTWKVGLTLALAFAAIAVLFLLVLIPIQRDQRQRLLDRDERLLQTLREKYERDLIYDVLSENEESLAVDLAALAAQPGVLWARLAERDLRLAATADRGLMGRILPAPALDALGEQPVLLLRPDGATVLGPGGQPVLAGQPVEAATRASFDAIPAPPAGGFGETVWQGEGVLHHHAELRAGDQSFGRLDILYSLAEVRRAEAVTRRLFYALVGTTFVLLLLLLNVLLSRMVIRPVRAVSEAMTEASTGRLDLRLPVRSRDEIGAMGSAFNAMASDLEASKRAIEDYSRNLEIKVAERTRALRESEEQLRSLKNHLETVLAHVATGVVSLDGEGRIATFNDRAGEILSVPAAASLGRGLADVLGEAGAPLVALAEGARQATDGLAKGQLHLQLPQGRRTLSVVASSLPGEGAGTVVVFEDLTQLLASQRLQAWKEAVDRVIHEIKNPLTPVGLAAQTLRTAYAQDRARFDAMFPSAIEMILKAVRDLKTLIADFTRFYRLPAAVMKRHDVNALVSDALALYQQAVLEGIRIETDLAPALPPVEVDAEQIRRVLLNVLGNGIDSMEGRRGTLAVKTAAGPDGYVSVSVSDEGAGIEDVERIFEPYYTTKAKGTGLGLIISRQIVEDHHGHIRVASRAGEGTTVTIELPSLAERAAS